VVSIPSEEELLLVTLILHLAHKPDMVSCIAVRSVVV